MEGWGVFFFPPGVDVHAEDGVADEVELDEEAEDEAAETEVDEALEGGRTRQHGLFAGCGLSLIHISEPTRPY